MALKPGKYNPMKPDIELFDFKSKKRFGLKLDGSGALQVGTVSQDDTVHIRSEGKRIGDFDEQRSWKGGRGIEDLSSNPAGYWDSMNAWTLTEGHLHQTLLWEMARGLRNSIPYLPSTTRGVQFRQLFGTTRYLATWLSTDTAFTTDYVRMWIKRVGQPGTLTVELCSVTGGFPGSVLASATCAATDFSDVVSVFKKFDWSSYAILASTTYFLKIYGASTDNKNNHWLVGGEGAGTQTYASSDGTTWGGVSFRPYYDIMDADVKRTFKAFYLDQAMYVVDRKDSGAASQLYINGDRGVATSGASTSITDTAKSWTVNRWAGAWVKIIRGTGIGQARAIASNTATALTISTAWNINPDTTSEYIIYATEWWTEITGTGFSVISDVTVANRIVYFASNGATMRHMVYNATTKAHSFGAQTGIAPTFVLTTSDTSGVRVWALTGNSLQYATAQAYTVTPAVLTFSTGVYVGDTTYLATGMIEKDSLVWVFKENGVWNISTSNTGSLSIWKLQSGVDKTPSISNGAATIAHQQFIYYSWLHSVIRIYGSSHDDVGQDWSGWGLPDGREGVFSSFDSYTSLLMCGVNAGTGTSSVLGWDGLGWHELFRAYDSNLPVRMVKVQVCPETRNRTWIDVGGDLVFQIMPLMKGSPRLDSGVRYMHEAVIESAAIDMGTASGLPKFIKELTVNSKNLGGSVSARIEVDYQVDDDVHTTNWTNATTLYTSPESTAFLGLSNVRKFAYRLRIISQDNTTPVDILGVIPNGYARVPYKMVWSLRCRADNITSRGRLVKPDELMRWLLDTAREPGRLEMLSQFQLAHKFSVIVHPPRMFPYKPAQNGQAEESVFTITLEEA